jgi:hypothetical protein
LSGISGGWIENEPILGNWCELPGGTPRREQVSFGKLNNVREAIQITYEHRTTAIADMAVVIGGGA